MRCHSSLYFMLKTFSYRSQRNMLSFSQTKYKNRHKQATLQKDLTSHWKGLCPWCLIRCRSSLYFMVKTFWHRWQGNSLWTAGRVCLRMWMLRYFSAVKTFPQTAQGNFWLDGTWGPKNYIKNTLCVCVCVCVCVLFLFVCYNPNPLGWGRILVLVKLCWILS
jgi:hypothetical protein